jgi:hypothetical protein
MKKSQQANWWKFPPQFCLIITKPFPSLIVQLIMFPSFTQSSYVVIFP